MTVAILVTVESAFSPPTWLTLSNTMLKHLGRLFSKLSLGNIACLAGKLLRHKIWALSGTCLTNTDYLHTEYICSRLMSTIPNKIDFRQHFPSFANRVWDFIWLWIKRRDCLELEGYTIFKNYGFLLADFCSICQIYNFQ